MLPPPRPRRRAAGRHAWGRDRGGLCTKVSAVSVSARAPHRAARARAHRRRHSCSNRGRSGVATRSTRCAASGHSLLTRRLATRFSPITKIRTGGSSSIGAGWSCNQLDELVTPDRFEVDHRVRAEVDVAHHRDLRRPARPRADDEPSRARLCFWGRRLGADMPTKFAMVPFTLMSYQPPTCNVGRSRVR